MNNNTDNTDKETTVFMSIDHLKKGKYELKILLDNKVIKTVQFIKT
ncbi:hypothetical protein [Pseudotamlana agarivorans]|nr:hypothetical protein [Tamlana agarivorans]